MVINLSLPMTQGTFAQVIGVDHTRISQLMKQGVLTRDETAGKWLLEYCAHLRLYKGGYVPKPAAEPDEDGEEGGEKTLNLTQEKAALAREQRIGVQLKNRIAEGTYAPIALLTDVLATASSAVVDRFDQLESTLRKACPDLDSRAVEAIQTVIANARNEWIRSTAQVVAAKLEDEIEGTDE